MLNNRQAGRRRGRGGQRQQSGGRDNGNRIDNRARGNAPQLLEKYRNLARDAQLAGDRVMTEYYLQFADHYFRVVAENRARFEDNRRPRDDWQADDGDDGDDGVSMEGASADVDAEPDEQPGRDSRRNRDRGDRNARRNGQPRNEEAGEENDAPATIDIAVLPPAFGSDGMVAPIDDIGGNDDDAPQAPRRRPRARRAAPEAEATTEG